MSQVPQESAPARSDGRFSGRETVEPENYEQVGELVREAEARGHVLIPTGLGNHMAPETLPPEAKILSLKKLSRVLRYEPDDFTLGVQTGMPLEELHTTLAGNQQEIPVDFPGSPPGTVGGALAQNRYGPRRGCYGSLRNYLIGVVGLRGGGRIYKAGGMVVKNVAGYDVMKLLIGSRGTLGPILEANFKLRPLPAARSARLARFQEGGDAWKLALFIRKRLLEPAVLSVLNPRAGAALDQVLGGDGEEAWRLVWSFEGNTATVKWLQEEVDGITSGLRPEGITSLDGPAYTRTLGFLASAREVEKDARGSTTVLSLSVRPTDGPGFQLALEETMGVLDSGPGDNRERWTIADATSGIHLARVRVGEGNHPGAIEFIDRVQKNLEGVQGNGELLWAPGAMLAKRGRLLRKDPNGKLTGRIREAFDPRAVFWGRES